MPEIDAGICPLVFSLCQQRKVPVLVTDWIARYLDERDLLSISTLSRSLNEQANSVIYRNIVLDNSEVERCGRKATLLLRTLVVNSKAAQSIRQLVLSGNSLYAWRREQWEKAIGELRRGVELPVHGRSPPDFPLCIAADALDRSISLTRICLDILRLTPFLKDIEISSEYFRYAHFRDELRNMFNSGVFQNLQSCSFCLDIVDGEEYRHVNAVQSWDDTLLAPFTSPQTNSINTVMTLHPDAVSRVPANAITRLVLHHCQIGDFDVDGLLAATPKLCYLEYHALVDYDLYRANWHQSRMRRRLGLHPLFDALHHIRDTLRELVASQTFTEDGHQFEGDVPGHESFFRQCYEVSELKHLKTLSIPYTNLLGWNYSDGRVYEWRKLLPTSLHHLTLTDDFEQYNLGGNWNDAKLLSLFSDLLVWLAICAQRRRPLEFRLILLHEDTLFKEPIRQEISRICEAHGILCSIEKHHKDFEFG